MFHGGKWTTEPEASRDEALIRGARGVILIVLKANSSVRSKYEERL